MKGDMYSILMSQCSDLIDTGESVFGYEEYESKIESMKLSVVKYYNNNKISKAEMLSLINTIDRGCLLSICS